MKYVVVAILFSVLPVCSCVAGTSGKAFAALKEQLAEDPQGLLPLLDDLEKEKVYPSYKLNYLRSRAYRSMAKYYMAMHYAELALQDKKMFKDTLICKKTYMLLAETAIFAYRLEKAVQYIEWGERYARKLGDIPLEANMLLREGEVYRNMGMVAKGYECVSKAAGLLSASAEKENLMQLSRSLGYLMAFYIEDNRLEEAWETGKRRENVVRRMEEEQANTAAFDKQKGYLYSKMAYLACKMGREDQAEMFFREFGKTRMSADLSGMLEINDYLLLKGDYEAVLRHSDNYFSHVDADSLNIIYIRTLYQESKAYSGLKRYKEGYEALLRLRNIKDRLRTDNERNRLFDMTDLTEAVHREYELKQAGNRLKLSGYVIGGLASAVVLLAVLLGKILWDRKVIRSKDRKMTSLILSLDDKNAVRPAERSSVSGPNGFPAAKLPGIPDNGEDVVPAGTEEDEEAVWSRLFFDFDSRVKEERLYLNYQLSRDDYARLMGVDRNRFAAILKEYARKNLPTYLNELRLEYSVSLFRAHPDWAVNTIAAESAFPSLSTFYRLFKERYGFSPKSFRSHLEEQEKQERKLC